MVAVATKVEQGVSGCSSPLLPGTRVTVYGAPGTVRYTDDYGTIAVNLDGEGARVDLWHPSQVFEVRS